MSRHSWLWDSPCYGKRRCQECGKIMSMQNHAKVGECPGNLKEIALIAKTRKEERERCHEILIRYSDVVSPKELKRLIKEGHTPI